MAGDYPSNDFAITEDGVVRRLHNRDIHRAKPDSNLQPNPVFAELTGKITVPVMTLHETADFRAPFWLEQDYGRHTERVGTSRLLVQRAIRAVVHCGYANAERAEAFEDLRNWVKTGNIPEGDDVTGDPSKLGLRWTRTWDPHDPAVPHK